MVRFDFRVGDELLEMGDGRLRVVAEVEACVMIGLRPLRCDDIAATSYCENYLGGTLEDYSCAMVDETRSTCALVDETGTCLAFGLQDVPCVESVSCLAP